MKTGKFTIAFGEGLHARPASELIEICNGIESDIKLNKDDMTANPKSILEVMALGAENGDVVEVIVEGVDEEEAYIKLSNFFEMK